MENRANKNVKNERYISRGGINYAWRAKYSLHHINRAVKMRSGPYSNNVKQETDQKLPERGAAINIFVAT